MDEILITLIPLFVAWTLDLIFGDPAGLPHLIVYFGKAIAFLEHRLNSGIHRKFKGGVVALGLVGGVYGATWWLLNMGIVEDISG